MWKFIAVHIDSVGVPITKAFWHVRCGVAFLVGFAQGNIGAALAHAQVVYP